LLAFDCTFKTSIIRERVENGHVKQNYDFRGKLNATNVLKCISKKAKNSVFKCGG